MAKVSFTKAITINLGNYNSIKFGYGLEIESDDGKIQEARDGAVQLVDKWLDEHEVEIRKRMKEIEDTAK